MRTYLPVSENIQIIGRAMPTENGLWMCYSATGAAFHFTGKQLIIHVQGDDRCEMENMDGNRTRLQIKINGDCVIDTMIMAKHNSFALLCSKKEVSVHVEILKASETAMSTCCLTGITTDDGARISPVLHKERLIEFAGDSITCGYGVDDEVAEHNFKTDTEDATKAYAYLTAQALNADHSLVSISGYGIISGYSGDGVRRADQILPDYYEKIGFSYGSLNGVYPQDVAWDFAKMQPDMVVINLGTNDQSFTGTKQELQEEYCREYQKFLGIVRKNNPKAEILCILGLMGETLCPMVEKAVEEYKKTSGDEHIHYAHFSEQLKEDGYAADWHPSQLTHRKAAEKLTGVIREIMHW